MLEPCTSLSYTVLRIRCHTSVVAIEILSARDRGDANDESAGRCALWWSTPVTLIGAPSTMDIHPTPSGVKITPETETPSMAMTRLNDVVTRM
jgi:hypothetical protein